MKRLTKYLTFFFSALVLTLGLNHTVLAQEPDVKTLEIVTAAQIFLNSLNSNQRNEVLFDFLDDDQRGRWSNFPMGLFNRLGLRWDSLTRTQRINLMELLGTILSPRGLQMVQEQIEADNIFARNDSPGGPSFGIDYYYVSLLGEPSGTSPWMLQFGSHHLAINATVVGSDVTLSPTLTGGQPTRFELNGEIIYIVEAEVQLANNLLNSLDVEQRNIAVRSSNRINLVLGPGNDGGNIEYIGVPGSQMNKMQQFLLIELIEARLGILNANDLSDKMALIRQNIAETYFAWYGSTEDASSAYWRITGPTVIIEYAPTPMPGGDPADHLHNILRNPVNDYGVAWISRD